MFKHVNLNLSILKNSLRHVYFEEYGLFQKKKNKLMKVDSIMALRHALQTGQHVTVPGRVP